MSDLAFLQTHIEQKERYIQMECALLLIQKAYV